MSVILGGGEAQRAETKQDTKSQNKKQNKKKTVI